MQLSKVTAILWVLVMSAAPALGQQSQTSQPAFWESGNAFLNRCDENTADFAQLSAQDKQSWILMCDFWLQGIRQGIEMTQQIRPKEPTTSPAVEKQNKETTALLKKQYGIEPSISTPFGNMCVPEDVTVNQLRLVVVQWMKSNPTKLGKHGAWLVYAALTNTYTCASKKEE